MGGIWRIWRDTAGDTLRRDTAGYSRIQRDTAGDGVYSGIQRDAARDTAGCSGMQKRLTAGYEAGYSGILYTYSRAQVWNPSRGAAVRPRLFVFVVLWAIRPSKGASCHGLCDLHAYDLHA